MRLRMMIAMIGAVLMFQHQVAAADPVPVPVVVPRAEQIDIKSKAGREYRLFIQTPAKEGEPPVEGYPVYYFTDANGTFPMVTSLARSQQVVLVGIGYPTEERVVITTRRSLDLTPEASSAAMKGLAEAHKGGKGPPASTNEIKYGGQSEFFQFIQNEVKPLVEKKVKIDKSRQALFGHSFGGLFTLYAMYNHPESFQTYIAASPSLWLNSDKLAEEQGAFVKKVKSDGTKVRLLLTLGGQEAKTPFDKSLATADDPRATLAKTLKEAEIDVAFVQFEGENHGSVVPFAHARGLRFAFEPAGRPMR